MTLPPSQKKNPFWHYFFLTNKLNPVKIYAGSATAHNTDSSIKLTIVRRTRDWDEKLDRLGFDLFLSCHVTVTNDNNGEARRLLASLIAPTSDIRKLRDGGGAEQERRWWRWSWSWWWKEIVEVEPSSTVVPNYDII